MNKIITEFKYTKIHLDHTLFNQPLYVLAQVVQYNLEKLKKKKKMLLYILHQMLCKILV